MTQINQPNIRDLAIIGDQRTCALIDKQGMISWYCPRRFDKQAIFSTLLDAHKGGYWTIHSDEKFNFTSRQYHENSCTLHTNFSTKQGDFTLTDFMPFPDGGAGICRLLSEAPVQLHHFIKVRADYGLAEVEISRSGSNRVVLSYTDEPLILLASHPIVLQDACLKIVIPAGEAAWVMLASKEPTRALGWDVFQNWIEEAQRAWKERFDDIKYQGPYQKQVEQSFRAIELLTHGENSGILAAATTALPEVIGGERNYDYRYVWLRDTAMVVSALIRSNGIGEEAQYFLGFLCASRNKNETNRFMPLYDLDGTVAPSERVLDLSGYQNSRPVRIGNDANNQLQLDANGNVLLAAKLIYNRFGGREHWDTVEQIADYLAVNWEEPDHGIWEEHITKHYTSSKVLAAKSLEFIAEHATSERQADYWRTAAKKIRDFVAKNCITSDGAYAVFAGSEKVDIAAALFPVWLYVRPDSPEMLRTAERIEQDLREGELYHRHLELFDARKEGVFLAGSLWMAQYYIMLENTEKAKKIIDACLEFTTDLGFFPEEGDIKSGEMLGNFPQTFVHASFIGAVTDLYEVLNKEENIKYLKWS